MQNENAIDAVGSGSVFDLHDISRSRVSLKLNHARWYLRCLVFFLYEAVLYGVLMRLQVENWLAFLLVFIAGILTLLNWFAVHVYCPYRILSGD